MTVVVIILIVVAALALVLLAMSIKIVREYERVVVFRLGRLRGARGPGLVLIIPFVERTRWVNLQVDTADVPPQDLITKDNVTVNVEAAVFFRVVDPVKAVVEIRDYQHGVLRIAQTTLRATLGQHDLDSLLANQVAINDLLKQIIDAGTEPWGVNVVKVETKDVGLPDTMKRAMARQAEAERERRAKVIAAEGEYQAAERLSQAAGVINREHGALTLRTLQTLAEIATEHNSTLVFPIPMDVLDEAHEHARDHIPRGRLVADGTAEQH
jgi:regulator of protease activity HflC (stomatin/prohibitin superfamily)